MEQLKTPREWALELGLLELRKQGSGQALLGEEVVSVSSSEYAAAAALHLWDHDEYHAAPDREVDGKLIPGKRLRISRSVFDSALLAGAELLRTDIGFVHVPVPEALGPFTPKEVAEHAKRLRSSKEPE